MLPVWKAIQSEVPQIAISSITRLGEGWSAVAYLVNDEFVFKFPKRADDWEELDREIDFLAYALPYLTLPVAVHLLQVRNSGGVPHGFAIHRLVFGDQLAIENLSDDARAGVASVLARFLRSLHDLNVGEAIEGVLRPDEGRAVDDFRLRDAQERVAPGLTALERKCLAEAIRRYAKEPENVTTESRIIHADLNAQHILYADGAVTGVLDWGEVSIGDPDYDFCYLYGEFGEGFVREVALRYGHRDPDLLVRKAHYFWLIDQVDAIAYGSCRASEDDTAAAWGTLRALLQQGKNDD